jgi:cysteinyl-tRNA synthetase
MDIYLHNTLTGRKEKFEPIEAGKVSMYNCGPTVYNYAHIGNLRSYVFADILRRVFEYNNLEVKQVINVTDIGHLSSDADDGEDKMTKALKREEKPFTLEAMREVAEFYFHEFEKDLKDLNIESPNKFPFASDHIKEDIELVEKLNKANFTYAISDGIYFDVSKFPDYGKLGNIKFGGDTESRIGENSEKKNQRDFALLATCGFIPSAKFL